MMKILKFSGYKLLKEAFLYFVDDFNNILKSIDHPISKALIGVMGDDIKQDINFLRNSDKVGYVDYISNRPIDKVWGDFIGMRRWLGDDFNSELLNNTDASDFYNQHLSSKNFSPIKLGKLVNTLLPGKFTPGEIEEFTDLYKAKQSVKLSDFFEIVSGEDIKWWYNESNYVPCSGTELGKSCMRYAHKSDYLDIYTDNPDSVSLLILKDPEDSEKIMGRALIWNLSYYENSDLKIGMDRIYSISAYIHKLFCDWRDSNECADVYGDIRRRITVNLTKSYFDYYPYMDTFSRLDPQSGILFNDTDDSKSNSGHYILKEQDGTFTEIGYGIYSDYEGENIPNDDSIWSEPLRSYIYRSGAIDVQIGSPEYRGLYPKGHQDLVRIWDGQWIHRRDSIYSDYIEEYLYINDSYTIVTDIAKDFSPIFQENAVPHTHGRSIDIYKSCNWYREVTKIWSDWSFCHKIRRDLMTPDMVDGVDIWIPNVMIREVYIVGNLELTKLDAVIMGINIPEGAVYRKTDMFKYHKKLVNDIGVGFGDKINSGVYKERYSEWNFLMENL